MGVSREIDLTASRIFTFQKQNTGIICYIMNVIKTDLPSFIIIMHLCTCERIYYQDTDYHQ